MEFSHVKEKLKILFYFKSEKIQNNIFAPEQLQRKKFLSLLDYTRHVQLYVCVRHTRVINSLVFPYNYTYLACKTKVTKLKTIHSFKHFLNQHSLLHFYQQSPTKKNFLQQCVSFLKLFVIPIGFPT